MIAGATGIDLFLLVLDAQEGARPQTHEHLAVLRLLGVDRGVVAVTKADAVDAETLQLAIDEASELVPGAEVVPVSAKTGAGLEELRAALARVAVDERDDGGGTRLYVDRSFSLPGIGHGGHRHALVGPSRCRRPAAPRAGGPHRASAERPGARPGRRRGRAGPARRGQSADARARRDRPRRRARRARPLPRHLSPRRQAGGGARPAGGCDRAHRDERRACADRPRRRVRAAPARNTGGRRARRPGGSANRDHRRRRRRARSVAPAAARARAACSCSTAARPRRSWPRSCTSR